MSNIDPWTDDAGRDVAQQRLHKVLAELRDVIGPGPADPAGDGPSGKPTLWEYVVVCCWLDDDRQDWVTLVPAAGMLTHHVSGLLRAGLAYGDYDPVDDQGDRR